MSPKKGVCVVLIWLETWAQSNLYFGKITGPFVGDELEGCETTWEMMRAGPANWRNV